MSSDKITMDGKGTETYPNATFRVELENGHKVLAYLSGHMRRTTSRFSWENKVSVEMNSYDLTKGRITYRHRT